MSPEAIVPLLSQTASILDRFTVIRRLGIDEVPLQRLFLIECECNISILACLDLDSESNIQSGMSYWAIATSLKTDVLETILGSGDEQSKAFKALKTMPLLKLEVDADQEIDESGAKKMVVSKKLRRLYVNAFAVRTAAKVFMQEINPNESGMREIRFRTRLKNLNKAYLQVAKSLRESLGENAA
jgi:hypothetical protein